MNSDDSGWMESFLDIYITTNRSDFSLFINYKAQLKLINNDLIYLKISRFIFAIYNVITTC